MSDIDTKYASLGGATGFLGQAYSAEQSCPDGVGRYRHFQGGSIYWSPQTGAHEVHGLIRAEWSNLGWERSVLGYPTTDETPAPDGAGRYNHFQGGSVYWTPQAGAHEVHGLIRAEWSNLGWERSFLGYPTTDETPAPDGIGRYNHFQGGSIYWTPQTGAHEVHGFIRGKWSSLGWERSFLGYPTTDESGGPLGLRISRFQHGSITWTQQDGAIEHSKPAFTNLAFNMLVASLNGSQTTTSNALLQMLQSDWRAFIRDNFELTPRQSKTLDAFSPQNVSDIQGFVTNAIQHHGQLVLLDMPALAMAQARAARETSATQGVTSSHPQGVIRDTGDIKIAGFELSWTIDSSKNQYEVHASCTL